MRWPVHFDLIDCCATAETGLYSQTPEAAKGFEDRPPLFEWRATQPRRNIVRNLIGNIDEEALSELSIGDVGVQRLKSITGNSWHIAENDPM